MSLASTSDRARPGRWGRIPAEHRQIAGGLLAVAAFAFAGKLAGAAKEIAVAWRYGVGAEVDAYVFVLNLVTLPASVWFSVLTVVLIPLDARLRHAGGSGASRFRAEMLGLTLLFGVGLSLAALLALPTLIESQALGLAPAATDAALRMIPWLSWMPLLGLVAGLYSAWLMSAGSHWNTLLEGVPSLAVMAAVLITGGIEPLVWGTVFGMAAQVLAVGAPAVRRGGAALPRFALASPEWVPFRQAFGVVVAAQAIMSVTLVVDQFYAAGLGEGAISSVGYATRVLTLLIGIGATAITRATIPVFSSGHAAGSATLQHVAHRWTLLVAGAGLLLVVSGWLLARPGIALLYERGTFTAADTEVVAGLFRIGLFQLPFYFASLVLISLHSSRGRYGVLLATGVLGLAMKIAGNSVLVPHFGVEGLMWSGVAVYAANTILLLGVKAK